MPRILTQALVPLTLLPLLAGCIAGFGSQDKCVSHGPGDFHGQSLRVLDHGAFDSMLAVIQPLFENQTGARLVQVKGQDAGEALRRAIESKGNPVADVIYGIDNALFSDAARAGILEPYTSLRLGGLHSDIDLDDFRSEGRLLATPADLGYVSVNYDRALQNASMGPPKTLADLANDTWARQFVVEDPRLSSPGLGFLVATVATFGENDAYDYLDYWHDLLAHGVLVVDDWSTAYEVHFSAGYGKTLAGFAGDKTLVVSYATSPAYEGYYAGSPPSVSLEPPLGLFRQVETAAILKCTPQLPLARAFVDFVLSRDFQDLVSANMAVYPVVSGAPVIEAFTQWATPPDNLEPASYTSSELGAGIDRWLVAWADLYKTERA